LAVVAAVGVDAILGAIQGSKEAKELDQAKAKLDKALGVTQQFSAKVSSQTQLVLQQTQTQQALFLKNMQLLNRIQPATFKYDYSASDPNATSSFVAAMANAVAEYGWLSTIRTDYVNFMANGNGNWATFSMMMNMLKPAQMEKQVADGFLSYAETKLIQPATAK